jgi:hypothetical protein
MVYPWNKKRFSICTVRFVKDNELQGQDAIIDEDDEEEGERHSQHPISEDEKKE